MTDLRELYIDTAAHLDYAHGCMRMLANECKLCVGWDDAPDEQKEKYRQIVQDSSPIVTEDRTIEAAAELEWVYRTMERIGELGKIPPDYKCWADQSIDERMPFINTATRDFEIFKAD